MEQYHSTSWISVHEEEHLYSSQIEGPIPVWVRGKGMFMGIKETDGWIARDFNGQRVEGEVIFYLPVMPPSIIDVDLIEALSKMELDKTITSTRPDTLRHKVINSVLEKRKKELNGYGWSVSSRDNETTFLIFSTEDKVPKDCCGIIRLSTTSKKCGQ